MKGSAETEVLFTILMMIISFFIAANTLQIVRDIANALALASAEIVARDVANLITLSSAAPHEIVIDYLASENFLYDTKVKERLVNVKLLSEEGKTCPEAFGFAVDERVCQGEGKSAIDGIELSTTGNHFTFSKSKDDAGKITYRVDVE